MGTTAKFIPDPPGGSISPELPAVRMQMTSFPDTLAAPLLGEWHIITKIAECYLECTSIKRYSEHKVLTSGTRTPPHDYIGSINGINITSRGFIRE